MAASTGRKADIYVASGVGVAYGVEAMSDVSANVPGAGLRTVYAVTAAAHRYFDPANVPAFQISLDSGGTWNPVTPDRVDAGDIFFLVSQQAAPAAQFRINSTGKYLSFSRVGGGHEWVLTPQIDLFDATEFGYTSKRRVAGVPGGTAALKRWWLDDSMQSLRGARIILILFADATSQPSGPRYEMYAFLKQAPHKTPVKGVQEEDLAFEIDSLPVFFTT